MCKSSSLQETCSSLSLLTTDDRITDWALPHKAKAVMAEWENLQEYPGLLALSPWWNVPHLLPHLSPPSHPIPVLQPTFKVLQSFPPFHIHGPLPVSKKCKNPTVALFTKLSCFMFEIFPMEVSSMWSFHLRKIKNATKVHVSGDNLKTNHY